MVTAPTCSRAQTMPKCRITKTTHQQQSERPQEERPRPAHVDTPGQTMPEYRITKTTHQPPSGKRKIDLRFRVLSIGIAQTPPVVRWYCAWVISLGHRSSPKGPLWPRESSHLYWYIVCVSAPTDRYIRLCCLQSGINPNSLAS